MQKWGLIRPEQRDDGETYYAFPDVAVIRQADEAIGGGASFRAVLRNLIASRAGQLAFDFRIEAHPAKVLQLTRREPPPLAALMDPPPVQGTSTAEEEFRPAAKPDGGRPAT